MSVIVISGAAGVGKSTVGRLLAERMRLPLLDLDTLTNQLLDAIHVGGAAHWNDPQLRAVIRPARYAVLRAAISDQSHIGAVAIAPFTAELSGGPEWQELVDACGAAPHVVWLHATAELIAGRRAVRAEARDQHILDAPDSFQPTVPHLSVEASGSPSDLVEVILRAIRT